MSDQDVFRSYLERFAAGDIDGAARLLAEDFSFDGPLLKASNKAEFLAGSAGLAPMVRGVELHRQWESDGEVCSIFDFRIETPVGAGAIPMAEWAVVRDGKLVSSRLIFDTAAMTALMPAS
jgi:SnoaL-like domain